MSKEIDEKFSIYLRKTLKGYANRQKQRYLKNVNIETDLNDINISKLSFEKYLSKQENSFDNLDVDYKHPENAFSNPKYYKAMKRVPIIQKQALYLLVVDALTSNEVAKILNTTPRNVNYLKGQAIINFKKNLEKLDG